MAPDSHSNRASFQALSQDTSNRLLTSPPFARVLEIALKFGREGREGKPIGTVFVLGTPGKLKPFCRPLIMNPCEGHSAKARDIQNPDYLETIRELAGLDGAFLVDRRGVVVGAGIYLDAPVTKAVNVSAGLGARHMAAAAISTKGGTVAVVVSESSGLVTVFSEGSAVLEIARTN